MITLVPYEFVIEVWKISEDILDLVCIIKLSLWTYPSILVNIHPWLSEALSLLDDIWKWL